MQQTSARQRPSVEQLIIPQGHCGRKSTYPTKELAAAALRQAMKYRKINGNSHAEKRWYECPKCAGFHLTSREEYNERSQE